ncbi:hypothetical protein [Phaeobacter sp. JH18-37]|uniref:hypothetical protein n=1 Tax=Phaeobacter sp. JH18-37 TaxID=3112458 RepID=UPI003A8C6EB5
MNRLEKNNLPTPYFLDGGWLLGDCEQAGDPSACGLAASDLKMRGIIRSKAIKTQIGGQNATIRKLANPSLLAAVPFLS